MNHSILIDLLSQHADWYAKKGKVSKKASISLRAVVWCMATASVLSMTYGGATAITVICAVLAASAFGLDRTFSFTRNWLEFSAVELKLRAAIARMEFKRINGATADEVLKDFQAAIKAVEAETVSWSGEVTKGVDALRAETDKLTSKP